MIVNQNHFFVECLLARVRLLVLLVLIRDVQKYISLVPTQLTSHIDLKHKNDNYESVISMVSESRSMTNL